MNLTQCINGMTICVLLLLPFHTWSQTPGGVNTPGLWFKTVPVSTDLSGTYRWKDFSGNNSLLRAYTADNPNAGAEYTPARTTIANYNFNPALDLTSNSTQKNFILPLSNFTHGTLISVWGPATGNFNTDMFLYSMNGREQEGYIFTKDIVLNSQPGAQPTLDYGSEEGKDLMYHAGLSSEPNVNKFRERALRVATFYRANNPGPKYSVWGEKEQAVFVAGNTYLETNTNNNSTYDLSQLNNIRYTGKTPEFIYYDRLLTALERRKVESYLAVKYGFPLDLSYISSRDRLLWDIGENEVYNNRTTAYGRDDLSGLYQRISTTSYEEEPYYSDINTYDSFDGNNSYNKPSRYRLLVAGREWASPMADDEYVFWGDDGGDIGVEDYEGLMGLKVMSRKWLVQTNIKGDDQYRNVFPFASAGLTTYTGEYKTDIIKQSSDTEATGELVSVQPLADTDGFIAFTLETTTRGPVTVKFGTSNPNIETGQADYGYQIASNGRVYKIVRGMRSTSYFAIIAKNSRVEIYKEKNLIGIRIDDTRVPGNNIEIEEEDRDKSYYATVLVEKQTSDIIYADFRYGGFIDTGNQVELSYLASRANAFANYRNGDTYLLIDRSGEGNFNSDQTEFIKVTDVNTTRSKIIFNNLFWDTDGNGKDMFTFAYRTQPFVARYETTQPTCNGGTSLNDGSVHFTVIDGVKGYTYNLLNNDTEETYSGDFFTDSYTVGNLSPGSYTLTVGEIGGDYFKRTRNGSYFKSQWLTSTYPVPSAFEWNVVDPENVATVGYMITPGAFTNANNITFSDAMRVEGLDIYLIKGGELASTPVRSVEPGTRLRIEHTETAVNYYVDSVLVDSLATVTGRYYGVASIESDNGELNNFSRKYFLSTTTYRLTDYITFTTDYTSVSSDFTLAACVKQKKATAKKKKTTSITPVDIVLRPLVITQSGQGLTINLQDEKPGSVCFLIFDEKNKLVEEKMTNGGTRGYTVTVHLNPGNYKVLALTIDKEFSQTFTVQ